MSAVFTPYRLVRVEPEWLTRFCLFADCGFVPGRRGPLLGRPLLDMSLLDRSLLGTVLLSGYRAMATRAYVR